MAKHKPTSKIKAHVEKPLKSPKIGDSKTNFRSKHTESRINDKHIQLNAKLTSLGYRPSQVAQISDCVSEMKSYKGKLNG